MTRTRCDGAWSSGCPISTKSITLLRYVSDAGAFLCRLVTLCLILLCGFATFYNDLKKFIRGDFVGLFMRLFSGSFVARSEEISLGIRMLIKAGFVDTGEFLFMELFFGDLRVGNYNVCVFVISFGEEFARGSFF